MRDLKRNRQDIYYALFIEKETLFDEYGNETGEFKLIYSAPKKIKINVSSARGESYTRQFGDFVDYDKVMVTTNKNIPIDENSILWVDNLNTDDPHDYIVKKVAKSLNNVSYAIGKVSISG